MTGEGADLALQDASASVRAPHPKYGMETHLTPEVLRTALPRITAANAKMVAEHAPAAMARFNINTPRRIAAFLGQCAHESTLFTARVENLNYSADALRRTWPGRFSVGVAKQYARKPVAIANRAYANRMGNGDEKSGDGWRHRGMGFKQLTGKINQTAFANAMGMTLDQAIKYLVTDEGAIVSAAWFWGTNRLNDLADRWEDDDDIIAISRKINGGDIGREDRIAKCNAMLKALEAAA